MKRVAVFGGTGEGREIALYLKKLGGEPVVFAATEYARQFLPESLPVSVGRLDAGEMERLFCREPWLAAVDATHPFAREASRNIRTACGRAGLPYVRLLRPGLKAEGCLWAEDAATAPAFSTRWREIFS